MSKTILTADDSPSMRGMITFTLKNAGYTILEAVDGKDALAKLSTAQPQMVITDLNMPNMDGMELIRKIRAIPQYRYIPIVLLTTESDETKKQVGRAAGASGWIVKPFRSDQLLAVVKRFIG